PAPRHRDGAIACPPPRGLEAGPPNGFARILTSSDAERNGDRSSTRGADYQAQDASEYLGPGRPYHARARRLALTYRGDHDEDGPTLYDRPHPGTGGGRLLSHGPRPSGLCNSG